MTHAPISTGMAAGLTRDSCLQKGAAEIVERDALMLHWKCRITAPAIDPQSIAGARPDLYQLIASTRHLSARWRFNLLTLDIDVPVISATLINDEGIPLTSFGIASNVCPLEAAASAMQEALLSRFLLNRTNLAPLESEINVSRFRTLRDHLFGHAVSASLRDSFLELFGGQPVIDVAQLEARFAGCKSVVSALNKAGLEVYCVDITSEDIRSAGIEVWRVLVPTAEPLDNDHLYQHQGGERLSRFLKNKGVATYNMLPHPFP